jgi:hypothetical protein
MSKLLVWLGLLVLLCALVMGVQVSDFSPHLVMVYPMDSVYAVGEPFVLHFKVLNSSGLDVGGFNVDCLIWIFNGSGFLIDDDTLVYDGAMRQMVYDANLTLIVDKGQYSYYVECSDGLERGYVSDTFFVTQDGLPEVASGGIFLSVMIVLLPLLFGFLLLKWSKDLSDEHSIFKLGMGWASLVSVFISLWLLLMSVNKFFFWDSMVDALSDVVFWFGMLFVLIILYFFLYFIKVWIESVGRKRNGGGDRFD